MNDKHNKLSNSDNDIIITLGTVIQKVYSNWGCHFIAAIIKLKTKMTYV